MGIWSKITALRWGRGLFRLWVVASIIWALGALIVGIENINLEKRSAWRRSQGSSALNFDDLIPGAAEALKWNIEDFASVAFVVIAPPLMLLIGSIVLYRILRWIARGFQPS